jgi:hypothetical protein
MHASDDSLTKHPCLKGVEADDKAEESNSDTVFIVIQGLNRSNIASDSQPKQMAIKKFD